MNYGISFQGYVPIRNEPSHSSEMGSQLLFGETFRILKESGTWYHISMNFDGFEGWVPRESIAVIKGVPVVAEACRIAIHQGTHILDMDRAQQLILPAGSVWGSVSGDSITLEGRSFKLVNSKGWINPGNGVDPEEIGKLLISVPGLHGGRCGFGFDSPGLVQTVLRCMGISIPRDCVSQSELGSALSFIHEAEKGDLAFFDNTEGEISHAGIIIGDGRILHAYDQVRIDTLDHQGIYNPEIEGYSHKLRIIKRLSP